MRRTHKIIILSMLVAILVVGIGYAAIQNITLNVSSQAQAVVDQGNFIIKFTGTPQVSDSTRATAAITNDTNATINVNGLTSAGDKIIATYTIQNASSDLSGDILLQITNTNKEYFKVRAQLAKNTLAAGETTTATLTIELIKTPIENSVSTTIGVQITAVPLQPEDAGTVVAQLYPKMMERIINLENAACGGGTVASIIGQERIPGGFEEDIEISRIGSIIILDNNVVPSDAIVSWDISEVNGDGKVMAWLKENQEDLWMRDLYIGGNGGVTAPDNSEKLFAYYNNCSKIEGLEYLKTSNVTNMSWMFYNFGYGLTSLDLSNFDTTNVTDMSNMFYNFGYGLTSLDLSNFDTQNVTDMSGMFTNFQSLTNLNLSSFNTQNVTNMSYMFSACYNLTSLDLSNFNTQNVTNMESMFYNDWSLATIYINPSIWQTASQTMYMFDGCGTSTLTPKP